MQIILREVALLLALAEEAKTVITVEDGVKAAGAGSAIMELFEEQGLDVKVVMIGVDDVFVEQGEVESCANCAVWIKRALKNAL